MCAGNGLRGGGDVQIHLDRAPCTLEAFYRIHITPQMHVSPDIQLIIDPSENPDRHVIAVLGLRVRFLF